MKARSLINAPLKAWAYLQRQPVPSIDIGDLQFTIGFGALVYGVSLVSVAAAWITAGVLLLATWLIPRIRFARAEKE